MGIKGSTVNNPSLLIQKASESMSGKYKCFATNAVGTASSLPLVVKSKYFFYTTQVQVSVLISCLN